jgi:hypothetical protein
VTDEVDPRRVEVFAGAAMLGVRPEVLDPATADGPTELERLHAVAAILGVVRQLRESGFVEEAPRQVLDVTPSEIHRLGRKIDALRALRTDAPWWRDPQPLGDMLRTVDADRRADALARLRAAGFEVPSDDAWEVL